MSHALQGATAGTSIYGASLTHRPSAQWEFDASVAAVFPDMLDRSIPNISGMRECVFEAGACFVQPGCTVVDLGCSLGDAMEPFVGRFGAANRFIGVDASQPMVDACRERFGREVQDGYVQIRRSDLRKEYCEERASLTLCILTLMFTPIEYRHRILAAAYAATEADGAVILVEKVLGASKRTDDLLTAMYRHHKAAMGYSQEAIDAKRGALEGVLVPLPQKVTEGFLAAAGFREVECIWRTLNFVAWIAIKG